MGMTTISSVSKVFTISLFIFLSVLGRGWTAAPSQQHEDKQNSMSFASSSSPSSSPLLKAGLGQKEDEQQKQEHQPPPPPPLPLVVARRMQSNSRIPANKNSERDLITQRVRLLPKDKLNRYKMEAARQLQASLIRTFQALCISAEQLPGNVRVAAKQALAAAQAGTLNPAIVHHLPAILQQGSQQQGQPANQLQIILANILPTVPAATQGSLQGLLGFVSANLTSVNNLLGKVLGGVPDLLGAVIKSLTNNLGEVTGTLNGTLASLGSLLGGVIG